MPKDTHTPRVMTRAHSRRVMLTLAQRLAERRRRDTQDGGALQPVDRPKTGSGGAAVELETA